VKIGQNTIDVAFEVISDGRILCVMSSWCHRTVLPCTVHTPPQHTVVSNLTFACATYSPKKGSSTYVILFIYVCNLVAQYSPVQQLSM